MSRDGVPNLMEAIISSLFMSEIPSLSTFRHDKWWYAKKTAMPSKYRGYSLHSFIEKDLHFLSLSCLPVARFDTFGSKRINNTTHRL